MDGNGGALNPTLLEYGIAQEKSDIRAHASFPGRRVTVYKTADMIQLVGERQYREVSASQPGVEGATAKGYLVPVDDIQPQYVLTSEAYPWGEYDHEKMDLAQRGDAAVHVVRAAIKSNRFPLWVCGIIESDKDLDIQGTDIIVQASRRIQVKYDWGAYPRSEGGTGNLFIQTMERNPLKIYSEDSGRTAGQMQRMNAG